MKYDDNLRPIVNLDDARTNRNSGDAAGNTTTGTSSASRTGADSGNADSDRSTGDDSSSGRSGSDASGNAELPLGTAADDPRARRKRGRKPKSGTDGEGNGDGRSNSSGADDSATSGQQAAAGETRTASEATPRVVDFDTLSGAVKSTAKNTHLTKEFIAEGWGILFAGAGIALRDKETWALDEDTEAKELADRTLDWFRSIDKKKSALWEKRIATWQPFLMLAFSIIAIIGPRLAATRSKRRVHLQAKTGSNNTAATREVAPAARTVSDIPVESPPRRPENGRANFSERPFRAADFDQLYGRDDA